MRSVKLLLTTLASAGAFHGQVALPRHRRCHSPLCAEDTKQRGFPIPFFQQDIPEDQQPTYELRQLQKQTFQDWPCDDGYTGKLFNLYAGIMLFLSLPISYTTFYVLPDELPQLFISANFGTLAVMILFVLRLKVSWGFVSQRLKARESYYEADQTGRTARKDKATLLRDRLIEKEEVAPALRRVDTSFLGVVGALLITFAAGESLTASLGDAGPLTLKTLYGDEAIRYENRLKGDDEFARREQLKFQSRGDADGNIQPGYCNSRYYKILAGGNGQGGVGCQ